jgi:hypothetical protein
MSNVTLFNPAQAPAHVRARTELSTMAKALGGGGASGGKRISIKGGVFRLYHGGKEIAAIEDRFLDVVIVNAAPHIGRVWFAKSYDGEATAPDCWSADGTTPSSDSSNKQAESCATCPKNIAGSGQGNSRACRYQQRLAVVLPNDIGGDVLALQVPATSIWDKDAKGDDRPLQAYARYLGAQKIEPSDVVTRIKFDTKSESPKMFFKATAWVDGDDLPLIEVQSKSDDAIKAITMSFSKNEAAAPAPLAIGPRPERKVEAKAEAKSAKLESLIADEEQAEEPVVRKEEKKASAVPAKKSSLMAMVDDWE